jgi:hypothetical protein
LARALLWHLLRDGRCRMQTASLATIMAFMQNLNGVLIVASI